VLYSVVKRLIDIVAALFGLLIGLVFFIPIAIAIKLDSPGSVIFSQTRLTKNQRRFNFFKFRTMIIDSGFFQNTLDEINEATGPLFKSKRDPRITRVGKVLRKFSLDELPQLWNVLKGDMSLVGPRPPLVSEVARYEEWQLDRLRVKGGMTGLWQVSGRGKVDFYEMAKLDLYYVDHPSLLLDLWILFKTIPVVVLGRGTS